MTKGCTTLISVATAILLCFGFLGAAALAYFSYVYSRAVCPGQGAASDRCCLYLPSLGLRGTLGAEGDAGQFVELLTVGF
jgi:hypothetical protein